MFSMFIVRGEKFSSTLCPKRKIPHSWSTCFGPEMHSELFILDSKKNNRKRWKKAFAALKNYALFRFILAEISNWPVLESNSRSKHRTRLLQTNRARFWCPNRSGICLNIPIEYQTYSLSTLHTLNYLPSGLVRTVPIACERTISKINTISSHGKYW